MTTDPSIVKQVVPPHSPAPTGGERPPETDRLARLGSTTVLLTLAVAAGQVVSIVREVFVASQVGASASLDALLVALVAPMTIAGVLQSGTAAALIAAIGAAESTDGHGSARRLAGAVLTWVFVVSTLLMILVTVLAQPIVALTGPGFDSATEALAATFVPIVSPLIVLSAMGTLVAALCQSAERFRPIATAAIANPVVAAAVTIGLWAAFGVEALAVGMTAGAATTLLIMVVGAARAGVLPRPTLRAPRALAIGFLRHAAPLWASSTSLALNLVSDRAVASLLPPGSVSALRYGQTVMLVPVNAVGSAWGTVAYPALVRSANEVPSALGSTANSFLRIVIAVSMPVTIGAMALAPLVIDVAYVRGAFDASDARSTALVMAALAPTFVLSMVQAVVIGAHNARRAGVTLLIAGLLHAGLNLGLDLLLAIPLGVAGIGIASSLSFLLVMVFLLAVLGRREPSLGSRAVIGVTGRALLASLVPGIPVGVVAWSYAPTGQTGLEILMLVAGAAVGLVGFLGAARALHIQEIDVVVGLAAARIRRR